MLNQRLGRQQLPELFKRYAFGKIDLFLNKVNRTPENVFEEIMDIHRCEREDAVALLAGVLNGCNVICGDSTPEMTRAKKLLLKQSYAKEHWIYSRWAFVDGGWIQRTLPMDAQGKTVAKKHVTVLLAFSPSVTVGSSWETYHFEASFGMFNTVCLEAEYLLQMLRRFRKLKVTEVFIGSSTPPREKDLTSKLLSSTNTTKKYNTDITVLDSDFEAIVRRQHNALMEQSRSSFALKKIFERAVYSSNAFNVIREVPVCFDVGAAAVIAEQLSNDAIEAILNAKPLQSESELTDALPEEKHRFNMLNRFFKGNVLPAQLSTATLRTILSNHKAIKFLHQSFGWE